MQYFVDYITMREHYNHINNALGVKQMIYSSLYDDVFKIGYIRGLVGEIGAIIHTTDGMMFRPHEVCFIDLIEELS